MKILFFGDIVGRPGREALEKIIPKWKEKYQPDLIIANGENSAHGKGITEKGVKQILNSGIDLITLGDHTWSQANTRSLLENYRQQVIRPANFPPHLPGAGYSIIQVRTKKILVINLIGRVFMKLSHDNPIRIIDQILKEQENEFDLSLVDFHAETTAEKACLGWYLDGRVSALIGTHTHVPTADEKILPQGTAFITDAGMNGLHNSSLGTDKEKAIQAMIDETAFKLEISESGPVEVNAILLKFNSKNKAEKIKRIQEIIDL